MFINVALGILLIALPLGAIIKNINSTKTYSRFSFFTLFLLVSLPAILISFNDIATMFYQYDTGLNDELMMRYFFGYLLICAYPFYQRVCWRVNDAKLSKFFIWISLIPYINIIIFIFLCFAKTKPIAAQDTLAQVK